MATDEFSVGNRVEVTGTGVVTCMSEMSVSCTDVGVVTEEANVP